MNNKQTEQPPPIPAPVQVVHHHVYKPVNRDLSPKGIIITIICVIISLVIIGYGMNSIEPTEEEQKIEAEYYADQMYKVYDKRK